MLTGINEVHVTPDGGGSILSHFQGLACSVFQQASDDLESTFDVRIHCAQGRILKANKQMLSLGSLLFRDIFSSACGCVTYLPVVYDIICPDFQAKTLGKVLDSIHAGKLVVDSVSEDEIKEINAILETFQIFVLFIDDKKETEAEKSKDIFVVLPDDDEPDIIICEQTSNADKEKGEVRKINDDIEKEHDSLKQIREILIDQAKQMVYGLQRASDLFDSTASEDNLQKRCTVGKSNDDRDNTFSGGSLVKQGTEISSLIPDFPENPQTTNRHSSPGKIKLSLESVQTPTAQSLQRKETSLINVAKTHQQLLNIKSIVGELKNQNVEVSKLNRPKTYEVPKKSSQCKFCKHVFSTTESPNLHTCDGAKTNFCSTCNIRFSDYVSFKSHVLISHKDTERVTTVSCMLCNKTFDNAFSYNSHVVMQHQCKQPLTCLMCDKVFDTEVGLKIHISLAHKEKKATTVPSSRKDFQTQLQPILQCPTCKDCFLNEENIKNHLSEKHGKARENTCTICNKEFDSSEHLNLHKALHHQDMAQCNMCSMVCKSGKSLQLHIASHHEVKKSSQSFTCTLCKHEFNNAYSYNHHMVSIHMPLPAKCKVCHQQFENDVMLQRHTVKAHRIKSYLDTQTTENKKQCIECNLCKTTFSHFEMLNKHLLTDH